MTGISPCRSVAGTASSPLSLTVTPGAGTTTIPTVPTWATSTWSGWYDGGRVPKLAGHDARDAVAAAALETPAREARSEHLGGGRDVQSDRGRPGVQHREPRGDRRVVVPVAGLEARLAELAPPRLLVPPGGDPAADVHVGVQPEHRVQVLAHVGLGSSGRRASPRPCGC